MMVGFLAVCGSDEKLKRGETGEDDKKCMNEFTSSMTVPLKSDALLTADLVGREQKFRIVLGFMKVVVRLLQYCKLKTFIVKTNEQIERS